MKLTKFFFFKNTPLNDFINYIHFESNEERDNFFLESDIYEKIVTEKNYNFIRDRLQVSIASKDVSEFLGVNYASFKSDFDNIQYYCFVVGIKYGNNNRIDITMVMDVITTFTQGNILETLKNLTIYRQHLSRTDYDTNLQILRTNGDIIKTTTNAYVHQDMNLVSPIVLIQCAVDLEADFGNVDAPLMTTSTGGEFDHIISPINIYNIEVGRFKEFMSQLADFPWIAQNIKKVIIVPIEFLPAESFEPAHFKHNEEFTFYKLKYAEGAKSADVFFPLRYSIETLALHYGLDLKNDKHLMRTGYTTLELYSWDGQQVLLDPAFLDDKTGFELHGRSVMGHFNEYRVYPLNYRTTDKEEDVKKPNGEVRMHKGSVYNDSFVFSDFTELPILIDNYTLGMAKGANQRQLAESKLLTNRVGQIFDPKGNIVDKIFNGMSLLSNISAKSLMGKATDEYEFYRSQRAEFADMQINAPTVTQQSKGNAFQLATEITGITVKMGAPSSQELEKIKNYYKALGFEMNVSGASLSPVNSMTVCNYLQFSGNYNLGNLPTEYMAIMKPLFENGVRLWHNNGASNPMATPISENVIR